MKILRIHSNKANREELSDSERIFDFLSDHKTGVLATVGADKRPHVVVLYYSVDSSLVIRFLTKRQTAQSHNLAQDHHATFLVYDEGDQSTVQIKGKVTEITDEGMTHEAFMNSLRSSLGTAGNAIPPISRLEAGEHIAYELKPVEIEMSVYKQSKFKRPGHWTTEHRPLELHLSA